MQELADKELEEMVLGQLLFDPKAIVQVFDLLELKHFYYDRHKTIYQAIIECFAKNIEINTVSVIERLKQNGFVNYSYEVVQLQDKVPSSATIRGNAESLINKAKVRQANNLLIQYKNKFNIYQTDEIDDKLLSLQEDILKIINIKENRDVNFKKEITEAYDLLESKLSGDKKQTGWKWSANKLTEITGGIEQPYVYVFAALKKTGKSKFIIDQINSLINQDVPAMFLSLEMGARQLTRWLWSRMSEVDSMKIRYPFTLDNQVNLLESEHQRLKNAVADFNKLDEKLIINTEAYLDYNRIRAKIYQAKQKLNIKVVLLDHLQRCNIPNRRGQNDAKAIEEFVYRLADMAKDMNVALVLLSQLSNDAENRIATIKDVKHSGGIAEGVDFIGAMTRESRINPNEQHSNKVIVNCWQRDGESGKINLQCDLTIGSFTDYGF